MAGLWWVYGQALMAQLPLPAKVQGFGLDLDTRTWKWEWRMRKWEDFALQVRPRAGSVNPVPAIPPSAAVLIGAGMGMELDDAMGGGSVCADGIVLFQHCLLPMVRRPEQGQDGRQICSALLVQASHAGPQRGTLRPLGLAFLHKL